jgi:N-acetylglucosamine-6-phosphate deacetylase
MSAHAKVGSPVSSKSTLLRNAQVVTPAGVLGDGWVLIDGSSIAAVGQGPVPPGRHDVVDVDGRWLLPGFVDLHMHGGGGHDVTASPGAMRAAIAFHRSHGTTRTLVSLVAAPLADLERQLGWVADLCAGGDVIGAHLEGPFLSQARCGAQNPQYLRRPDRDEFARLAVAARATLRAVTLAPELAGALDLVDDVVAAGIVAAIGHTDATYAQAREAIERGATLATHLFNGMRPVHHREPGVVGAALASGIACEVINDGIHVHPAITAMVARPPGRLVLVTDAIDAAGMGDGDVELGGQAVRVRAGEARLADTGSLAGSTLTMDSAVRRAVDECGLSIVEASAAASGNPARVLGMSSTVGAISVGLEADLVVLDGALAVGRVMIAGRWHDPAASNQVGTDKFANWSRPLTEPALPSGSDI